MTTVQRTFRLDESLDQQFCDIAEKLGTSPSDSLRMFVTAFVSNRGFPFDLRLPESKVRKFNVNHPNITTPVIRNGHAVLPASWREGDSYDE